MGLPKFQYVAPRKLAKAISLQKESGKFLAGGTDLLVAMKQKISRPELLIDLNTISELKGIEWDKKKRLRVRALTTLTQLKENSIVQTHFPVLSQTVPLVSTPLLQNRGTVGGNLCLDTRCYFYNQSVFLKKRWEPCFKIGGKICHVVRGGDSCYAVHSGDMASPLIALGAKVKIVGDHGAREIELQKFFSGSGIKANILKMNYPAASSGVSKTTTGKTLRPKGRGIHPDGNKPIRDLTRSYQRFSFQHHRNTQDVPIRN